MKYLVTQKNRVNTFSSHCIYKSCSNNTNHHVNLTHRLRAFRHIARADVVFDPTDDGRVVSENVDDGDLPVWPLGGSATRYVTDRPRPLLPDGAVDRDVAQSGRQVGVQCRDPHDRCGDSFCNRYIRCIWAACWRPLVGTSRNYMALIENLAVCEKRLFERIKNHGTKWRVRSVSRNYDLDLWRRLLQSSVQRLSKPSGDFLSKATSDKSSDLICFLWRLLWCLIWKDVVLQFIVLSASHRKLAARSSRIAERACAEPPPMLQRLPSRRSWRHMFNRERIWNAVLVKIE